ncbi:hypothetical protein [Actinomadura coerulea]|uniref:hypothetical protein n=1 Tax=Actinomadura coerulea TaxID=46159 RepID=UPI0034459F96
MTIIIALIVAHIVTRAWDESKARSAEARQRVEDRREEARQRRLQARAARSKRLQTARRDGPSDPLWWLWAAAWTVAAAAAGTAAAVAGAREGAQLGARQGYQLGREKAAARAARKRAEHDAYERGRTAAAGDAGQRLADDAVTVEPCPRCGALLPDPAACGCRTARTHRPTGSGRPTQDPFQDPFRDAGGAAGGDFTDPYQTRADEPEVIDAEVIGDYTTNERNDEMAQITSGMSGGDGEGYSSTITALNEIKALLQQVSDVVTDLGDTLVSRRVDSETTSGVSDVDDHLQAAVQAVEHTLKHAQDKHEPVAAAIAGAGGSGQIAETDWYDDL